MSISLLEKEKNTMKAVLTVKCIKESSVLPPSALWVWSALVWTPTPVCHYGKHRKKKIQLRKHTIIIKSSKICFEKILTSIFTVINVIVLRWTFGIIKIHFYVVINACNFGSIKPHSNSLLNRYPFVIRARNVPERTWMILWFVKLWQILPRLWNYSKYLSGLCNF